AAGDTMQFVDPASLLHRRPRNAAAPTPDPPSFPTRRSSDLEYTLPSAGSAALQAGNCADCMEKDTQVRHNFQAWRRTWVSFSMRSEEHTSELQSRENLVCRLLLEKKKDVFYVLCFSAINSTS